MLQHSRRTVAIITAAAALTVGTATPAAFARHGADDPAGHEAGHHARHHGKKRHRADDKARAARHGADDKAGDDRGGRRHGGDDGPNHT